MVRFETSEELKHEIINAVRSIDDCKILREILRVVEWLIE